VFGNFRARAPTPQSLSLIPSRCQSVSPSLISSDSLRETTVHIRIVRVLILHVVDGLLTVNPSIIVTQRRLMERLRSSETLSVRSAHLISVRVRLRSPARAVPVLPVDRVPRSKLLERLLLKVGVFLGGAGRGTVVCGHLLEGETGGVGEQLGGVTLAEVGLGRAVGALVAESLDGVSVVVGVVGGVREVLGLDAETT